MESENDFFFPMSEELIKLPPELTNQLSKLNFGISSVWTLPFEINRSLYFITFLNSKISVWNSEEKIRQFSIEGMIRKDRAVVLNVNNKKNLYFVLNNDCLYCLPDILDIKSKYNEINLGKKISFITLSRNHDQVIIVTTDQFIYFINSDGSYSNKSYYHIPYKLSFLKDYGEGMYLGGCQDKIYQFEKDFRGNYLITLDEYSKFLDINGNSENTILIGCPRTNIENEIDDDTYLNIDNLLLSSIDISKDDDSYIIPPIPINADYYSFHILNNNHDPSQPSYALISKSKVILLNNQMKILGRQLFAKQDYLISSFMQEDILFIHLTKTGLHLFTPYSENFELTDKNFSEFIFYYTYLFAKAQNDQKYSISSNFYEKCKPFKENLGEKLSESEIDLFIARKTSLSFEQILTIHRYFIQMISFIPEFNETLLPFLRTNTIYINLIQKFSTNDKLYRFSSFEKLMQLLNRRTNEFRTSRNSLTIDSSGIILESIREAANNPEATFDGYDKILNIINQLLSQSTDNSSITLQLIESKYLLTKAFDIQELNHDQLKADTDNYEKFALEYKIIDILYEIINTTLDFRRAINYAKCKIDIKELYEKFKSKPDIQRKLALLSGWEAVDTYFSYIDGIIQETEQRSEKSFSLNALLHLCDSLIDKNDDVVDAITQLNIPIKPPQ